MSAEIIPKFFRPREESIVARFLRHMDWSLLGAALLLALGGILFIYSSSFHGERAATLLTRQGAALAVGLFGLTILTIVPYQVFQTYARGVYVAGAALLVLTLLVGTRLRGSKSWIDLHLFYFQPIEVVRLALAVSLAAWADARPRHLREWTGVVVPVALMVVYLGLVLLQPDLSSALVMGPMTLAVLFAAGAPLGTLSVLIGIAALALGIPLAATYFQIVGPRFAGGVGGFLRRCFTETVPFLEFWSVVAVLIVAGWWFLRKWRVNVSGVALGVSLAVLAAGVGGSFVVDRALKQYQRKRLIAFVDPAVDPLGAGYNILQSKIAIGSGRFFGKGYLSGSQAQLGFLPEKHTDFIFSVVGEEFGFIGAVLVLAVFFWVAWRAFDIALLARDRFGRYLAAALGTYFAFSGVVNIGMVMGLMPVTGVPLPFLSYGGSGLVGACLSVGILLSIHVRRFVL